VTEAIRIVRAGGRHVGPAWRVIDSSRAALAAQGVLQWDAVYPSRDVVADDARRGVLYVLEDDRDRCLACVTLDDKQADEYRALAWTTAEPALVVHRLCVDPLEQGRGHARRLMDFAEAHAAANGYASVRLDAYTGNPRAAALYRRRGYREVGQIAFPRRNLPFCCFELGVPRPSER
jgi:ribosomal protein S18 acetylase RimI-like enzyme